jgi:hypothetical protein
VIAPLPEPGRGEAVQGLGAEQGTWLPRLLSDCRRKGDGVHQAMLGIARLHNLLQVG